MVLHSKGASCVLKESLSAPIPETERTAHAVDSSAPTKITEDTISILQKLEKCGVTVPWGSHKM